MKIQDVKFSMIEIPIKKVLKHASKEFKTTESLILKINLDGFEGFGECCPRKYVTGIDFRESLKKASKIKEKLLGKSFENKEEFLSYINLLHADNSIKAAFDISFTDALCKMKKIYLYEYFGSKKRDFINYDAGSPLLPINNVLYYIDKFYKQGIRTFKVKADNDIEALVSKVKKIREVYYDCKIKIDANSCWKINTALKAISRIEKYDILLIEDPINSNDLRNIHKIKKNTSIPLMTDETLISVEDAIKFSKNGIYDWFNIKISKNGGLDSSIRIMNIAKENGIKVQLGSHYGECGILESARRQIGCTELYISSFEGANRILLSDDITKEKLDLSKNLRGDLSFISDYGLGVQLKEGIKWT